MSTSTPRRHPPPHPIAIPEPILMSHLSLYSGSYSSRSTYSRSNSNYSPRSERPPRTTPHAKKRDDFYLQVPHLRVAIHNTHAHLHSPRFPFRHQLCQQFVRTYQLGDELGSGGYGFVMTATHRVEGHEVAVKFIIKKKVPEHAWAEDEFRGVLPMEIMLLSVIEHEGVVKCLDLYEDCLYFYVVQELHGSPWHKNCDHQSPPTSSSTASLPLSTPPLSPASSFDSLSDSEPPTLPHVPPVAFLPCGKRLYSSYGANTKGSSQCESPSPSLACGVVRPGYGRRPSYDLFECLEQSDCKRFMEVQARHIFAQVVDIVHYLNSHGVTHRDIKDENLLIDKNFRVKLIDFGSATFVNPQEPQPLYKGFYGTTAYASPEILLKKKYYAPPAEIWTLGTLLSFLLTGCSPFPSLAYAVEGKLQWPNGLGAVVPGGALDLMKRCLDPNPKTRATISEVRAHRWLVENQKDK
ncbi:kinase-like domain-containing protein [Crucibulum laeve]|uniref:Kinase-like domain-containing protein n=1 Tax=Crucibulum laeve TaxID=68775 RepID=A0A5C3MJ05_9AGAR|nr:kinase-like domain-containing protein [Crucibulum laeve]